MITPTIDVLPISDKQTPGIDAPVRGRSPTESCSRIKDLGFSASRHIKMYGERFGIVSDPYSEGDCIAVHAISGNDPTIRTLLLPITILIGMTDQFLKRAICPCNRPCSFGEGCRGPVRVLAARKIFGGDTDLVDENYD